MKQVIDFINKDLFVEAHIADLHFSAFDPKEQYKILKEQFIDVIDQYPKLDIISVDGDIYHHKLFLLQLYQYREVLYKTRNPHHPQIHLVLLNLFLHPK